MCAAVLMRPQYPTAPQGSRRGGYQAGGRFGALMEYSPVASPAIGPMAAPAGVPPMMPLVSPSSSPVLRSISSSGMAPSHFVLGPEAAAPALSRTSTPKVATKPSLSRTTTPNTAAPPEVLLRQSTPASASPTHQRRRASSEMSSGGYVAAGSPTMVAAAPPSPFLVTDGGVAIGVVGTVVSGGAPALVTTCQPQPPRKHTGSVVLVPAPTPAPSAPATPSPGAWTVVSTQRRRAPKEPKDENAAAATSITAPPSLSRAASRNDGEAVDIYYNHKELFVRSYTREMKQSRSFKAKKKTDYQVQKRREQSMRDRGWFDEVEEDEY